MEIRKDTRNELFKRQELSLVVEGDKNPGFSEVRKQISEKVGKPEENVDVLKVEGSFGQKKFDVEAHVYDSKEDLDAIGQLRLTKKQRDEAKKAEEEKSESGEKVADENNEKPAEKESGSSPVEDTNKDGGGDSSGSEQTEEKSESEVPVEERPEEEKKADKEERQGEEDNKEN